MMNTSKMLNAPTSMVMSTKKVVGERKWQGDAENC